MFCGVGASVVKYKVPGDNFFVRSAIIYEWGGMVSWRRKGFGYILSVSSRYMMVSNMLLSSYFVSHISLVQAITFRVIVLECIFTLDGSYKSNFSR